MEHRVSHVLGKVPTTELHPKPLDLKILFGCCKPIISQVLLKGEMSVNFLFQFGSW
jgi:hypothetical protein